MAGVSSTVSLVSTEVDFPKEHFAGLKTSNNTTDADHDIDIAPGECRDEDDTVNMVLASTLIKQIDANWAVGSNAGGLDTGTVAADTLYALWLIKRTDTGVVDALFSLSFSSPTMPTGYDKKRLIAAIKTDPTSNIESYEQKMNWFFYKQFISEISDTSMISGTIETGTITSVPPSSISLLTYITTIFDVHGWRCLLRTKGDSHDISNFGNDFNIDAASDAESYGDQELLLRVDSNKQIEYVYKVFGASEGSESFSSFNIGCVGFILDR